MMNQCVARWQTNMLQRNRKMKLVDGKRLKNEGNKRKKEEEKRREGERKKTTRKNESLRTCKNQAHRIDKMPQKQKQEALMHQHKKL